MFVDIAQDALCFHDDKMDENSTLRYEDEWRKLCSFDLELKELRAVAVDCGLRASRFRSVIWKLFLGALTPGSPDLWSSQSEESRQHYINLKKNLEVIPFCGSEPVADNPLSQNVQSTWHQYFCDKELRSVIRQDVIRTFPGVDFYKNESVQETMINILFYYARENPTMCYRQGMHEILAPVIFVIHCDHQALLHIQESSNLKKEITDVINPEYLEEDSYTLFRRIMNSIEGSYLISNLTPTSTGYFPSGATSHINSSENQVISQLNWIKERLLAPTDPELHSHLVKLDIPLPLFGIRWLRLLFGREFPLHDLLVLWDAIFADNSSFDLVNYLVVSMLVAIRNLLLQSDYTACLTMLMRYPPNCDVSCIIEYALHLKNPSLYKRPDKIVFQKQIEKNSIKTNNLVNYHPPKIHTNLPKTVNYMKYKDTGNDIVQGFTLNDPEVLIKELRHWAGFIKKRICLYFRNTKDILLFMNTAHCHNIMALCRIKLLQYHQILENSVPASNFQAHQALMGIHELSTLLENSSKKNGSRKQRTTKVEAAYEVEEKLILSPESKPGSPEAENRPRIPSNVDMTVFNQVLTPFTETDQEDNDRMWKSL